MQLPITGHPLHTRSLTFVVTQREDGRLRARGDVNDLRKCGFVPMVAGLQPAGIIHQMWIELIVDPASRRIDRLDVGQPFVAIEPSRWSEGECCRDPAPRLQELVGEALDDGFVAKLGAAFGGPRGCSHLLTLFQLMASGLPRALEREAARASEQPVERAADERLFWRSLFLDGYEADGGDIELAVQLHDFHGQPREEGGGPLDRFLRHDEVRVFAHVEQAGLKLRELRAFERIRERPTLATADWVDRSEQLAEIVGHPIIPGLARRIFGTVERAPENDVLRDALLQLAPGQIQVMAAITDRWFSQATEGETRNAGARNEGPDVAAIGGMADSCYMWRTGSPLANARWSRDPRAGP